MGTSEGVLGGVKQKHDVIQRGNRYTLHGGLLWVRGRKGKRLRGKQGGGTRTGWGWEKLLAKRSVKKKKADGFPQGTGRVSVLTQVC